MIKSCNDMEKAKEYIKYFNTVNDADGYEIVDVPFICSVGPDDENLINLGTEEEDKIITLNEGVLTISSVSLNQIIIFKDTIAYRDGMTWGEWINSKYNTFGFVESGNTLYGYGVKLLSNNETLNLNEVINENTLYIWDTPRDEIWYTTANETVFTPHRTDHMPTIISNTYSNGLGIMKLSVGEGFTLGMYALDSSGENCISNIILPSSLYNATDEFSIGYIKDTLYTKRSVSFGNYTFGRSSLDLKILSIYNGVSVNRYTFSNTKTNVLFLDQWAMSTNIKNYGNPKKLVLGKSITKIKQGETSGITSVEELYVSNTVTTIDNYIFKNCNLKSIVVDSENTVYNSNNNCNAIIETETNRLIKGCNNTIIPNNVTSIGDYAFYLCSGLTEINIPNSVQTIGGHAFYDTGLINVIIPSGVTYIGHEAFGACGELETITFEYGTEYIQSSGYTICSNSNSVIIYIPNTVSYINASFTGAINVEYHGSATGAPWEAKAVNGYVDGDLVYDNSGKTNLLSVRRNIEGIVTLPNTLNSISEYTFSNCGKLKGINGGEGITNIGRYAFQNSGLKEFEFSQNLNTIGQVSFYGCHFSSVTIPSSVTYIGQSAFEECNDLYNVIIQPKNNSDTISLGNSVFKKCTKLNSINIPNSINAIPTSAFTNCTQLSNVLISSELTSIGDYAFGGCSHLSDMTIPNTVTNIGKYAFSLSGLKGNLTIPDSVTSIGKNAFAACYCLENVTLPSGLTGIPQQIFYNCTGLTTVTIQNNVTSIENSAFSQCGSLQQISLPSSLRSIGNNAFNKCIRIGNLTIPNSVTTIGTNAFYNVPNISYNGSATGSPWGACSVNGFVDGIFIYTDSTKHVLKKCLPTASGTVIIDSSVTEILSDAFCPADINEVIIPNSVTTLSSDAFYYGSGEPYDHTTPNPITEISVGGETYYIDNDEYIDVTLANGTNVTLNLWTYYCFLPGTQITLADGNTKAIEDIRYDDNLLVWNFDTGEYDTAYPLWLTKSGGVIENYYVLTLDDGTVLKASGANTGHKIYNTDDCKFDGIIKIEVGKHVYTQNGIKQIVSKEFVEETVPYYNIMTDRHINCFAEGILTSMRYNSIYPFSEDMKFIKDGRTPRPYSEFEAVGISRYWYDGLRLSEQTDTLERIRNYIINRLEKKMLPKE